MKLKDKVKRSSPAIVIEMAKLVRKTFWVARNKLLSGSNRQSVIVYTTHKAGSMFVYRLLKDIAIHETMRLHSPNNGTLPPARDIENRHLKFSEPNSIYGPIRIFSGLTEDFCGKIILILRDPRDVLTSMYYSYLYSHLRSSSGFNPSKEEIASWEQSGIDGFVREEGEEFLDRYQQYIDLIKSRDVLFLKYEDMVENFSDWLDSFLKAFDLDGSAFHTHLLDKYRGEFKIEAENKMSHKRNVKPGDHKNKLSIDTIEKLNADFNDILHQLGYL